MIDINRHFRIGSLELPHRLIQGPLAGFSCAPFRELYSSYVAPAYCVSEMISAQDLVKRKDLNSRYLYRSTAEKILCYQLSGNNPCLIADAAYYLETIGADLIDLNCGCPKTKIRKKGAGSALLDDLDKLISIVTNVRARISIPFTVKIRIQGEEQDIILARALENAGADALIVHGRRFTEDYDIPCDLQSISNIKQNVNIPVIANGDICSKDSLKRAIENTGCDAYMISRAGTGKPWLYQELLEINERIDINDKIIISNFMNHLEGLAKLEGEYKAVLQSKKLIRYYFKSRLTLEQLNKFYTLDSLLAINNFINLGSVDKWGHGVPIKN